MLLLLRREATASYTIDTLHEMSFATQVLECVERTALAYPGARVVRVRIAAGEILALNEASLTFCLEAIAAGSVMDGATIEMTTRPLELRCARCGPFALNSVSEAVCPVCGGSAAVSGGRELIVEEIELDDPDGSN
jgi:hydrogenase nickel incorporation protein HypA/HybF